MIEVKSFHLKLRRHWIIHIYSYVGKIVFKISVCYSLLLWFNADVFYCCVLCDAFLFTCCENLCHFNVPCKAVGLATYNISKHVACYLVCMIC